LTGYFDGDEFTSKARHGVAAGARTPKQCPVAALFLLAAFCSPLATAIPAICYGSGLWS